MPRESRLADALRQEGVVVREAPGWRSRGNADFKPQGIVCHHTGKGTANALLQLCIDGHGSLPGPLAQVVLDPDGVAHVIAAGRANHAGEGGWRQLQGNRSVFGIEAVHPGDEATPWPQAQIDAYHRVCTAMLRLMESASTDLICGHREWAPTRKIDPAGIDMDDFRENVFKLLNPPVEVVKVRPMYDPPVGPIAAVWQDADGKVLAGVGPDGSVFAWGLSYAGGPNGKSYFAGRKAAAIGPRDDGLAGYMVTATSGETYRYP